MDYGQITREIMEADKPTPIRIESLLKNLTPLQIERGNEYFSKFHDPITDINGQKCNNCGDHITGTLGVANFPSPGEGSCLTCGHPFRWKHDIPEVGVLEPIPLCYIKREDGTATIPGMLLPIR